MLLFQDKLESRFTEPPFTLQVYLGFKWNDIHTVKGESHGETIVSYETEKITVDDFTLETGCTYPFRWIDAKGTTSNTTLLTIPAQA